MPSHAPFIAGWSGYEIRRSIHEHTLIMIPDHLQNGHHCLSTVLNYTVSNNTWKMTYLNKAGGFFCFASIAVKGFKVLVTNTCILQSTKYCSIGGAELVENCYCYTCLGQAKLFHTHPHQISCEQSLA